MQQKIKHTAPQYLVVTINNHVLWQRTDTEVWMLSPPLRYVLNADTLKNIEQYVGSKSNITSASKYKPACSHLRQGGKLLIDRHHDRGIGDMLFLSGPIRWIKETYNCDIFLYVSAEKAPLFENNRYLYGNTACTGPILYDSFDSYNYQWLISDVTEYDSEPDQLNVYDALFMQLGVDPSSIPDWAKRPYLEIDDRESQNITTFFNMIKLDRDIDLCRSDYCVVAPLAHSSIRSASYKMWLGVIGELAKKMPVMVIGHTANGVVPTSDMPFASFYSALNDMSAKNKNVINFIGDVKLRTVISACSRAKFGVTLDSGLLYILQAFRVPTVSIWGSHHPSKRIGYDKLYMDLAIFNDSACRYAPCYSYAGFPRDKCPDGATQTFCQCVKSVDVNSVLQKINIL